MRIDHIHFFVTDAEITQNWFQQTLGFYPIAQGRNHHVQTYVLAHGDIRFVISSPLTRANPVADFLKCHPAGVVDLAFQVDEPEDLIQMMDQLEGSGRIVTSLQTEWLLHGTVQWLQIKGWGNLLRHTLIYRSGDTSPLPVMPDFPMVIPCPKVNPASTPLLVGIDHVVINVPDGELVPCSQWYSQFLGFQPRQLFTIQTNYSGLRSQVLVHPEGSVQLPINEPTSTNSQIQEFLDLNGGAGVQHIALQTPDIIGAIAQFRHHGLTFLDVPPTYYELQQSQNFPLTTEQWEAISSLHILVDQQEQTIPALLMQAFTKPIFEQPTFFLELIQRQRYVLQGKLLEVQGFGEGNFRALFTAMEQQQINQKNHHKPLG